MKAKPYISVVIPVYGCAVSLSQLNKRLNQTLLNLTDYYEIILVNDASPDNAWSAIKQLTKNDDRIKGINLSRNFGQHYAITAGLDHTAGDWIIVMDCDLQDQPEEILKLYKKAIEGYDIVFGRRVDRKDSFLKKLSSKLFFKIYDYLANTKTDNTIANFSIISRKVVTALKLYRESNRAYTLLVDMIGFRRTHIDIEHSKRVEGKSSYTFKKLVFHAVNSVVSQSNKPLLLSIQFGFTLTILSFIYILYLIYIYFIDGIGIEGWTSVMVSVYFIGGLIFMNLGFIGLYIGKIFDETKSRPLYIIDEITWKDDRNE
jgi:dolichol-phosphate mannosyltransferase